MAKRGGILRISDNVVGLETGDGELSLALGETFRVGWVVRQNEEGDDGAANSTCTFNNLWTRELDKIEDKKPDRIMHLQTAIAILEYHGHHPGCR